MTSPVVLRGTIASLAAATTGAPSDFRGLMNKTPRPLRIDEIRILTPSTAALSGSQQDLMSAYSSGSIQLRIGNVPITAGFVPLPAVTWPKIDYAIEGGYASRAFAGRYIRFEKPVYLSPHQHIGVQFRYETIGLDGAVPNIQIVVLAREVESVRNGYTPWIASWLPTGRVDGTGNFIESSTSAHLVNPFPDEMIVERLIGRILYNPFSATDAPLKEETAEVVAGAVSSIDQIRVRIEDHRANQIVRDSAPFKHVFDLLRRSWEVNTILEPRGFFKVTIESNLSAAASSGYTIQPFIGMLGYRKVG